MSNPEKRAWPASVVAYTPFDAHHALTMIRVRAPLEASGVKVMMGIEEGRICVERAAQAEVVLIQRDFPRFWDSYCQIIHEARRLRKPVIYELDDLIFALPAGHPDRQSGYYAPALAPMLHALASAGLVITSTPLLAEYLKVFNANTWVLPNHLDDRLWKLRQPADRAADAPVVLGYMGGETHLPDLETIAPALLRLLERFGPRISLKFWGGPPPASLADRPGVEWIHLGEPDYLRFVERFNAQESDLWIAPLAETPFNRCKSPIKFYEYSALGAPGVYARLEPYTDVIEHGQNGFLASTLEEWESCLVQLIENAELRRQMGRRAQDDLRKNGLLSQHAGEWGSLFMDACEMRCFEQPAGPDGEAQARRHAALASIAEQVTEYKLRVDEAAAGKTQMIQALEARLAEKERQVGGQAAELAALRDSASWKIGSRLVRLIPGFLRRKA